MFPSLEGYPHHPVFGGGRTWSTISGAIPHGVIGNTTVFGTVILGSSPGGEASTNTAWTAIIQRLAVFVFFSYDRA